MTKKTVLGGLLLMLGLVGNAYPITMQDLFNGGSITAVDKLFFNWQLLSVIASDPLGEPDFSQVEVLPLTDQEDNPGIRYVTNGEFTVVDDNFLDILFAYDVIVLNAHEKIKDNSLEIIDFDFVGLGGTIGIFETVFDPVGDVLAFKEVGVDNLFGTVNLFDSAEFPPQSFLSVEKNVFLAGDFPGDIVTLLEFEQRFSQIPEPPMAFMIVGAAVALFLRRKRAHHALAHK